jgi:hypothetical protein
MFFFGLLLKHGRSERGLRDSRCLKIFVNDVLDSRCGKYYKLGLDKVKGTFNSIFQLLPPCSCDGFKASARHPFRPIANWEVRILKPYWEKRWGRKKADSRAGTISTRNAAGLVELAKFSEAVSAISKNGSF